MSENEEGRDDDHPPDEGGSGCPFHGGGSASPGNLSDRALDRRSFVRSALAIGGTGALAAVSGCATRGGTPTDDGVADVDAPRGDRPPSAFPERQHAWADDLATDRFGNNVLPTHQLVLLLDYVGDGTPSDDERESVEAAFLTLERAFQRLTGGDPEADNEGLVQMVGYSPSYFDRFEADLPGGLDLATPEAVLRETGDDPGKADHFDAVVLLSSDSVPVLLAAEEALFGGVDVVNGVEVRGTLADAFERVERRTAFNGAGLPRERLGNEEIPQEAPLSMGYRSGFSDNQASEDFVTIPDGPFTYGATFQVSRLRIDLDRWYDRDRATRDELMFSHEHDPERVGEAGEGLADDSGITEDVVDDLAATARERGRVGHAAKTARARNGTFRPRILRRSEGVDDSFHEDGQVGFSFSAVMEGTMDFVETRRAMNADHLDEHVEEGGHGILPFVEVTSRATFLLPPRSLRSLPTPRPDG